MEKQNPFLKIASSRYSCKKFAKGKEIPAGKLETFLEAIRLAPSSYNTQPWRIVLVSDGKVRNSLKKHSWFQPQVTDSSILLVFSAETDRKKVADDLSIAMKADAKSTGEKIKAAAWIASLNAFSGTMPLSWEERQVYLALGNAMNSAESLGLASCPLEGINPKEYKRILNLPESWNVLCALAVGYPEKKEKKRKIRLSNEQVFFPAERFL